jgi:hypothetical protein
MAAGNICLLFFQHMVTVLVCVYDQEKSAAEDLFLDKFAFLVRSRWLPHMGGREKGFHLRRLLGLVALAGAASIVPLAAGAISAAASVTVPAPSCYADGGSKVTCTEASSPSGVTVTWYIYDEASDPQNYTTTGGPDLTWGCAGALSVHFSYVSGGVTYVSGTGKGICIKGYP